MRSPPAQVIAVLTLVACGSGGVSQEVERPVASASPGHGDPRPMQAPTEARPRPSGIESSGPPPEVASDAPLPPLPKGSPPIAASLHAFARGEAAGSFSVVYDDLHGLHGGETLRLEPDGTLRWLVKRRGEPERTGKTSLRPRELRELARILLEIAAWEQREPERMAVPDESRARLSLRAGGHEARVWEWYNDMKARGRIERVKTFLERYLPKR